MKVLSAIVAMLLGVSTFVTAEGQRTSKSTTQVCTLRVSGMTCAGCEAAVRMATRSIAGVTDVKVSYAKKNAEVTYDPAKTSPVLIAKVITEKSGFKAEVIQQPAKK